MKIVNEELETLYGQVYQHPVAQHAQVPNDNFVVNEHDSDEPNNLEHDFDDEENRDQVPQVIPFNVDANKKKNSENPNFVNLKKSNQNQDEEKYSKANTGFDDDNTIQREPIK